MTQLLLFFSALLASVVDDGAFTAAMLDGTEATGRLAALSADAALLESDQDGAVSLPLSDLLDLRRRAKPDLDQGASIPISATTNDDSIEDGAPIVIELVDGSRLLATELTIANRIATIATSIFDEPLEIPTSHIQIIRMTAATNGARTAWRELASKDLAGDVLLINKRDGQSVDYLTGVVGDVDDQQLMFQWDGEEIPVRRNKIAGVAFYHAVDDEFETAICRIHMSSGDRLNCSTATLDEDSLTAKTPSGIELRVPLSAIDRIDYSAGKLIFLDDMQPVVERWTPLLQLPASADLIEGYGLPRRNQSFRGSALALLFPDESSAGASELRNFSRGLAIRSRTELEYRLESGWRRFTATAGIDPECANQGTVVMEIFADNRLVWRGVIEGGAAPLDVDVDVSEARRLKILVDYGDNLDFGDRIHLVNPKVTK